MTTTQCKQILAHMQSVGPITALEALDKYQCFRLASRISDLKSEGHLIQKEMIEIPSGKRVAKYWLETKVNV